MHLHGLLSSVNNSMLPVCLQGGSLNHRPCPADFHSRGSAEQQVCRQEKDLLGSLLQWKKNISLLHCALQVTATGNHGLSIFHKLLPYASMKYLFVPPISHSLLYGVVNNWISFVFSHIREQHKKVRFRRLLQFCAYTNTEHISVSVSQCACQARTSLA